jgi:hypothetical protein
LPDRVLELVRHERRRHVDDRPLGRHDRDALAFGDVDLAPVTCPYFPERRSGFMAEHRARTTGEHCRMPFPFT